MTAVVGILNKSAIALAADSAVTVTSGSQSKIFNRANKIFTLSKYEPVGVMIYNSASLMATPWEIIIKVFRDELGMTAFPRLSDYMDKFIEFLVEKNYYSEREVQSYFIQQHFVSFFDMLNTQAVEESGVLPKEFNRDKDRLISIIERKIASLFEVVQVEQLDSTPHFADFQFEDFNEEAYLALVKAAYNDVYAKYEIELSPEHYEMLKRLLFENTRSNEFLSSFTGLVFAGYGKEDVFPGLLSLRIANAHGKRLRYYIDNEESKIISATNPSAICPFAQQDVIETILLGIDPKLNDTYLAAFERILLEYSQTISDIIGTTNPDLIDKIQQGLNIPEIVHTFAAYNQRVQQTLHLKPLLSAVSYLSKEDLAEMAESLVYLTYLKRRMTNAEESVGGPVDVALISKSDGFIWIKRQHYFKPELNQPFFANYLKSHIL